MCNLPRRDDISKYYQRITITLEPRNYRANIRWREEPDLRRNIELYQQKHKTYKNLQGNELVQFWIDIALNLQDLPLKEEWEPENRVELAWQHLTCYCEETCYHAATNFFSQNNIYTWADYFSMARCIIYDRKFLEKQLSKYDPEQARLDTYLMGCLVNILRERAEVSKFSHWRILCKTSNKKLREALVREGHSEPDISRFIFARKYFQQTYVNNTVTKPSTTTPKRWPDPVERDFQDSAESYNEGKTLPSAPHEVAVSSVITAQELQKWMLLCIKALQNYPRSIVAPQFSIEALQEVGREVEDEQSQEVLEPEEPVEDPSSLGNQTMAALRKKLLDLKPQQQELLILYYVVGLNQEQLAARFKVTQAAICHRLRTIKNALIKVLSEIRKPSDWVPEYVTKWLEDDYQSPLYSDLIHITLVEAIKKLDPQEREVLRLRYGQKLDDRTNFNTNQTTDGEIIVKAKLKLEENLLKAINEKLEEYIKIWLPKFFKSIRQAVQDDVQGCRVAENPFEDVSELIRKCLNILRKAD